MYIYGCIYKARIGSAIRWRYYVFLTAIVNLGQVVSKSLQFNNFHTTNSLHMREYSVESRMLGLSAIDRD
jgi:hypothetical protein